MNFALILFCLTVGTGVFWFADVLHFKKRRQAAFEGEVRALDERMAANPASYAADHREREVDRMSREMLPAPGWLEFPASFFPVIAVVFSTRRSWRPFRMATCSAGRSGMFTPLNPG